MKKRIVYFSKKEKQTNLLKTESYKQNLIIANYQRI
jgi:hypothetical protein